MKVKPILFSSPMVLAILAGKKTQTRRVMQTQPREILADYGGEVLTPHNYTNGPNKGTGLITCGYGRVGDRLWVRETLYNPNGKWLYKADDASVMVAEQDKAAMLVWAHHKDQRICPTIHMPRWASRVLLEIIQVRAERLQDIMEDDALAEGVDATCPNGVEDCRYWSARMNFRDLWDSINGQHEVTCWDSNPFIWAITFKRVEADAVGSTAMEKGEKSR